MYAPRVSANIEKLIWMEERNPTNVLGNLG